MQKMQRENVLRAVFRKNMQKMQRENVLRAVFQKNKPKMECKTFHMPFLQDFKSFFIKVDQQSMLNIV